jgi:proteasome lid subunit RPN8/RPN11
MPTVSLTDWFHGVQSPTRGRWRERQVGPNVVERTWIDERPRPRTPPPAPPLSPLPSVEVPELRANAAPTVTVNLGTALLGGLCEELERGEGLLDTVETGGNLFGRRRVGVLDLYHASGPGADGRARRFVDSVRVSIAEADAEARELQRIWQDDVSFVGGWHTHPRPHRTPSDTDRASALGALDDVSALRFAPYWVDLILTADSERGWESPHVHGWVTRRTALGAVTEPARIEGGS